MKHNQQQLVRTDLSKRAGSMSEVIQSNHELIDNCSSVIELKDTLLSIFKDNNIDTVASRRLINNVSKQYNIAGALFTVYNSYLFGSGLSVNR